MPNQILHRRGTEAQHTAFTGGTGEITYVTDNIFLAIHTSSQVGGFVVPKLTANKRTLDLNGIVYANSTTTLTTSSSFVWDGSSLTVGTLTGMIKGANGVLSAVTGATDRVAFWSDANTISSNAGFTYDGTTLTLDGDITLTGAQTIQTSSGVLTVTGTGGLTLSTAANTNILLSPNGTGDVLPGVDNTTDLGASGTRWATIYGVNATVSTTLTVSSLTQKSVLFAGASGAVSQDNANFQYDSTTASFAVGRSAVSTTGFYLKRSGAYTAVDFGISIENISTSSTASVNKHGLYIVNTGTWNGASAVNYGILIDGCSGGTTNWGIYNNTAADCYLGTGNIGIGTTSFGTNAVGVLGVKNGTAPSTGPADTVQFYSSDDAIGHTIPSFYCEGTNVIATGQADSTSSVRIKMRINGVVVTLLAI